MHTQFASPVHTGLQQLALEEFITHLDHCLSGLAAAGMLPLRWVVSLLAGAGAGACAALGPGSRGAPDGAALRRAGGVRAMGARCVSAGCSGAGGLRLRGGGKDKKGGDDDEEMEKLLGKPDPDIVEEDAGARLDFHNIKIDQAEKFESGELKVSAELLARKKDKNKFDKVCCTCWCRCRDLRTGLMAVAR